MNKKLPLILGLILLFIVTLNLIRHIFIYDDFSEILWFCNFASLICAIGLIFNKRELVNATLIASIPAQFMWILDYLLNVFIGFSFGRTLWLADSTTFTFILSTVLHGILIPISLYGTYLMGFSKKAFYYLLFFYILLMFPLTYFFTTFDENRNCVFYPCDIVYEDSWDSGVFNTSYYGSLQYLFNQMLYWTGIGFMLHFFLIYIFGRTKNWKVYDDMILFEKKKDKKSSKKTLKAD